MSRPLRVHGPSLSFRSAIHAAALLTFAPISTALVAQLPAGALTRELVAVNTDVERYLRVLQVKGAVPTYSWSIRAFSLRDLDRILPSGGNHPWSARVTRPTPKWAETYLLTPRATAIYNSAFPYGFNDGAIWAGRGLTGAVQGGVGGHVGPLSFSFEPIAFWTQNRSFPLLVNELNRDHIFADAVTPGEIDLPQRFGDGAYHRFDAGQSTIRLDLPVIALGVSTANSHWGPAIDSPLVLGNNAAGFPHLFVGTSEPLNIWVGHVHGRLQYGRLTQSRYAVPSATTKDETRRFVSAVVGSFRPRGLSNLEIGGIRFFQTIWRDSGFTSNDFLRPIEAFSALALQEAGGSNKPFEPDNQLASAFFRWVFPTSSIELYGEYLRDDHNLDQRDFIIEPDHESAYMLGLQKVWTRADGRLFSLRVEHTNARLSALPLGRPQSPMYVHTVVTQGHTQYGEILGAASAYGGGGTTLEGTVYDKTGRWTASWVRFGREQAFTVARLPMSDKSDVIHALTVERVKFLPRFDLTWSVTAARDFNRNFASDVTSLRASSSVRFRP